MRFVRDLQNLLWGTVLKHWLSQVNQSYKVMASSTRVQSDSHLTDWETKISIAIWNLLKRQRNMTNPQKWWGLRRVPKMELKRIGPKLKVWMKIECLIQSKSPILVRFKILITTHLKSRIFENQCSNWRRKTVTLGNLIHRLCALNLKGLKVAKIYHQMARTTKDWTNPLIQDLKQIKVVVTDKALRMQEIVNKIQADNTSSLLEGIDQKVRTGRVSSKVYLRRVMEMKMMIIANRLMIRRVTIEIKIEEIMIIIVPKQIRNKEGIETKVLKVAFKINRKIPPL